MNIAGGKGHIYLIQSRSPSRSRIAARTTNPPLLKFQGMLSLDIYGSYIYGLIARREELRCLYCYSM